MSYYKIGACLVPLITSIQLSIAQERTAFPGQRRDSVQQIAGQEISGFKTKVGSEFKNSLVPADSLDSKRLAGNAKNLLAPLSGQMNSDLQTFNPLVKLFDGGKIFTPGQADIEFDYNYVHDTAGLSLGLFHEMQGVFGYSINYSMSLQSIPFNVTIKESNGFNVLSYTPFNNFYKFHFDREKYLQLLRSQIQTKINPEAIATSINNKIRAIRQRYEQELQKEISGLQSDFTKETNSIMTLPPGICDLQVRDLSALRNKLLPLAELDKYHYSANRYQELLNNKSLGIPVSDSLLSQVSAGVKRYEALQKIYKKVIGFQQKFENNKLVKDLRSKLPFSPGQMKTYISNPTNLIGVLEEQADLGPLQKLFSNIKNLDIGQSAVQSGELNMQNVMNTGINGEFQNKKMGFGFIAGKNNTVNHWTQAGLTSTITNQYAGLAGIKLGSGYGLPGDQSVSVNFFNINNGAVPSNMQAGMPTGILPVVAQKSMVFSLHSSFAISGKHHFAIDISKSFSSIQSAPVTDTSGQKMAASNSIFSGSPVQSLAGKIDYNGSVFNTDIRALLKKVGLGYSNPGNTFLRKGESEVGLGLSRSFLRNKFTIKYDFDYRDQVFDPGKNYSFVTLSNKLQAGVKISRSDRIRISWIQSSYRSSFYGLPDSYGNNSRVQLDGGYAIKIDQKKIINNTSFSLQDMSIPQLGLINYISRSVMLMHSSALQVGKNLLTLTLIDNRSNNSSYYFNTSMFSTESAYSYSIWNTIHLSSGLGYYSNYGWNKQVGINQQVSSILNNKLSLNLQLSYRKAVQVIQSALANQFFVNAVAQYHFK